VVNRVLGERLQEQRGHERPFHASLDLYTNCKSIAPPHLLDREVRREQGKLIAQRHQVSLARA
jgi:hypothetical protein